MSIIVTTGPSEEPLTLAEAKLHLRVDDTDEDALITSLITAARQMIEIASRRALCTQSMTQYDDDFEACGKIVLERPPVQSVTSVQYIDSTGTLQTLDESYWQLIPGEPAIVELVYGKTWPYARPQSNAVRVNFVCGYGAAENVPELAKAAMRLMIGHLYENREAVNVGNIVSEMPLGVKSLISMLRWGDYL